MDWNYLWDGEWPSGIYIVIIIFAVCFIGAKVREYFDIRRKNKQSR